MSKRHSEIGQSYFCHHYRNSTLHALGNTLVLRTAETECSQNSTCQMHVLCSTSDHPYCICSFILRRSTKERTIASHFDDEHFHVSGQSDLALVAPVVTDDPSCASSGYSNHLFDPMFWWLDFFPFAAP